MKKKIFVSRIVLLSLILMLVTFSTTAQKVTLTFRNAPFEKVLNSIKQQTGLTLVFSEQLVDINRIVSINVSSVPVEDALNQLLMGTNLSFEIKNNKLYLVEKKSDEYKETHSNSKKITGLVTEENGDPIIGATVVISGLNRGTTTNINGEYTIDVPKSSVLVFSYIGFKKQEIVVENQKILNVKLISESKILQEIVVVGYGTQSISKLTTSVSSTDSKDMSKHVVPSLQQALSGKLAGVEVLQTTGDPGSNAVFRIRGIKSINGGTQPLIVVDGQPLSEEINLSNLNMSDIEKIDVLKDAASTSIYGSRGANGVVMITTKHGFNKTPQFSFNFNYSTQQVAKTVDLMDAYEFANYRNNAYKNSWILQNPNKTVPTDPTLYGIPSYMIPYLNAEKNLTNTNWQDEIYRVAPMTNFNLSAVGGSKDFNYYLSGNYVNQEGIILGTDFNRISVMANIESNFTKWLKFGLKLNPAIANKNKISSENYSDDGIVLISMVADPFFRSHTETGDLAIGEIYPKTVGAPVENPVALATRITDKTEEANVLTSSFLEITPFKNFTFKSYVGADYLSTKYNYFRPSYLGKYKSAPPVNAVGKYQSKRVLNWLTENTLHYKKVTDKHNIDALLGYTVQFESSERGWMNGTTFTIDDTYNINLASQKNAGNDIGEWALISYLSRVVYDYKSKYLISGSLRRDGSSRFGANSKWGYFPSLSVGWKVTSEDFFPKIKWLNLLKLRASYGKAGNFSIPNYASIPLLSSYNYVFDDKNSLGVAPSTNPNDNLTWETTKMQNYALDAGFFDSTLKLSIDYYISYTSGMLLEVPVPLHSGFVTSYSNIGKSKNNGLEINLQYNKKFGEINLNSHLILSTNKNKVLELGPDQQYIRTWFTTTELGKELSSYWGYRSLGVLTQKDIDDGYPVRSDAKPGYSYKWEDVNKDGIINEDDKTILGSYFPDYTLNFTNTIEWKNLDFSFQIQSVQGLEIFNYTRLWTTNPEAWSPLLKDVTDYNKYVLPLKNQNDKTYQRSSLLVEDGSYIRIKNISLGYTLPVKLCKKLFSNEIRLFFSAENPFTFTKYTGSNPEVSSRNSNNLELGIDYGNYPSTKTFSGGLSISF